VERDGTILDSRCYERPDVSSSIGARRIVMLQQHQPARLAQGIDRHRETITRTAREMATGSGTGFRIAAYANGTSCPCLRATRHAGENRPHARFTGI
jgi:hypothetical protein